MLTRKGKNIYKDASTQTDGMPGIFIFNPLNVTVSPYLLDYITQRGHNGGEEYYDAYDDEEYDDAYDDEEYDEEYDDAKKSSNKKRKKPEKLEYCGTELDFFNTLTKKKQDNLLKEEKRLQVINYQSVPLRFQILESRMDDKLKAYSIKKLDSLGRMDPSSGEYNKMMNFLDGVSKIPIGHYKNLACSNISSVDEISNFLNDTKGKLNNTVFGHNDCKDQIIRLLAQWISNPKSNGLVIGIEGPMGCGKCHASDTPILMADGTIKLVQDIEIGDNIMGDDSTSRLVLSLGQGEDMMYDVQYENDHGKYTVNSEHILCLYQIERGFIECTDNNWVVYDYDFEWKTYVTYLYQDFSAAKVFLKTLLPRKIEISVLDYLRLPLKIMKTLRGYKVNVTFDNCKILTDAYAIGLDPFAIPLTTEMKTSSLYSRQDILAGIIDRCGVVLNNKYNMFTSNFDEVNDILFLARSLGLAAKYIVKNRDDDDIYQVIVYGRHIDNLPVRNILKRPTSCQDITDITIDGIYHILYKINVIKKLPGTYYGFTLDGNHKYILGDFTVTHNTTLVKEGICKALGLPFGFIPLGGISDGSYLIGHSYTYEGSKWGRIVDILMNCGCMNPILFFDELDKISNTRYGDEIKNILIHLTDSSQNSHFHDKYFSELSLDLSKCLIIFSYNDGDLISPILKDRMVTIKTHGYNNDNKVEIVNEYMLKELFDKFGFKKDDLVFTQDIIKSIIRKTNEEKGVRNLKRSLESIISQINLARLLKKGILLDDDAISFPYTVKQEDIEKLLKIERINDSLPMMYM